MWPSLPIFPQSEADCIFRYPPSELFRCPMPVPLLPSGVHVLPILGPTGSSVACVVDRSGGAVLWLWFKMPPNAIANALLTRGVYRLPVLAPNGQAMSCAVTSEGRAFTWQAHDMADKERVQNDLWEALDRHDPVQRILRAS